MGKQKGTRLTASGKSARLPSNGCIFLLRPTHTGMRRGAAGRDGAGKAHGGGGAGAAEKWQTAAGLSSGEAPLLHSVPALILSRALRSLGGEQPRRSLQTVCCPGSTAPHVPHQPHFAQLCPVRGPVWAGRRSKAKSSLSFRPHMEKVKSSSTAKAKGYNPRPLPNHDVHKEDTND